MASTGGRDDKVELLRQLPWAAGAPDDSLRWLARVADGFGRPAGATVARGVDRSRWAYLVVAGTVAVGDDVHGPGALVVPDADVVARTDCEVLAFPRQEEPALHRRFPIEPAPITPRRLPQCPRARARSAIGMASRA